MRTSNIRASVDTFFQQKFKAKSLARGYHGEFVSEDRWNAMFDRRLRAVVPMDAKYMAETDGSVEARGRGSGLQLKTATELGAERWAQLDAGDDLLTGYGRPGGRQTPYMQMTFAPLERRLDTALFRAMFASSPRQARNFIIHGHVKVNGIKCSYPGYKLNPGDMFQVNPEMAMYAAGAQRGQGIPRPPKTSTANDNDTSEDAENEPAEDESSSSSSSSADQGKGDDAAKAEDASAKTAVRQLKALMKDAKELLEVRGDEFNAARKRQVRAWRVQAKKLLAQSRNDATKGTISDAEIMDNVTAFMNKLSIDDLAPSKAGKGTTEPASPASGSATAQAAKNEPSLQAQHNAERKMEKQLRALGVDPDLSKLSDDERKRLLVLLTREARESQVDEKPDIDDGSNKLPFQSPWVPRPWLPPFAFIPRYLEVHHKICAAVYLRHPVARPGRAEVPTPFPEHVNALAHNFYLKRR